MGQNSTADSVSRSQGGKRLPCRVFYGIEKGLWIVAPEREVLVSRPCIRNRQEETEQYDSAESPHQFAPPEFFKNIEYQLGGWTPFSFLAAGSSV